MVVRRLKTQVLTHETASVVRSITNAVVVKNGEPFFICPPDANLPLDERHGFGLYHHASLQACRLTASLPSSSGPTIAELTQAPSCLAIDLGLSAPQATAPVRCAKARPMR